MVVYTCYRCNYNTNRKSSMENHFNRKVSCITSYNTINLTKPIKIYILKGLSYIDYKTINNKQDNTHPHSTQKDYNSTQKDYNSTQKDLVNNINHFCNYCNKVFKFNYLLTRHLKTCKVKNDETEILRLENKLLKNKLNEYEEENEELNYIITQKNKIIKENKSINKYTNCNNNTTNNNTTNNTTNNITINNYITPNIDYLEYNIKKDCIYTDEYMYLLPLFKALFFNKEHPENHSISYSNVRSNNISVYNGNEWVLRNRVDTINDIIDNCDGILSEFINDIRDSAKITYKQGKMINLYEKYILNYTLNDTDYKNLNEYIYMETKNLNIKP
jgi:hypothetical protein